MAKIMKFPINVGQAEQPEQPELQKNEVEQVEFDEVTTPDFEEAYALIYAPDEHYISRGHCFRCGHKFDYSNPMPEQVWTIQGKGGYRSEIDNSTVSIEICDTCMVDFLSQKQPIEIEKPEQKISGKKSK